MLDLARVAGKTDRQEAIAYCNRSILAHRAVQRTSGEVEAGALLARYLIEGADYRGAGEALDRAVQLLPRAGAEATCAVAYGRALSAKRTGDYRTAQQELDQVEGLAEPLQIRDRLRAAQELRAQVEQELGQFEAATRRLQELSDDFKDALPCDRARFQTTLGWARYTAREAGEDYGDPAPFFRSASAFYDGNSSCAQPNQIGAQQANSHLNLALAEIQAGRSQEARRELDRAREISSRLHPPPLYQRLWSIDLEARLAIAAGKPQRALALYQKLRTTAADARSPDGLFRARLGEARAWLAARRRARALKALLEADRGIDEQSPNIPLERYRDAFVAQRSSAAKLTVELLVQSGAREKALLFVRKVRSRLLRELMLGERLSHLGPPELDRWRSQLVKFQDVGKERNRIAADGWPLPSESRKRKAHLANLDRQSEALRRSLDALVTGLPRLASPGVEGLSRLGRREVLLAYHPTSVGWLAFAADARGVETSAFDLPPLDDVETLSRRLLGAFRNQIERADRVRVLPYGPLSQVEFQALTFAGEPLFAHRSVVYSLDLPVARPTTAPPPHTAALIFDPLGNLSAARRER
ncbi:MAG TPA: tetratricopeptide repeat protein, partial [Thermoanaerobaculia bacterium]